MLEPKFPIQSSSAAGRSTTANKKPTNHTLEDVAEEVLNGMFCHYEPPDPHRVSSSRNSSKRKAHKGILLLPKEIRKQQQQRDSKLFSSPTGIIRRVRWVDEIEAEPLSVSTTSPKDDSSVSENQPPSSAGCNVTQACFDAGMEVGCYSSSAMPATTQKMNAQQAIAAARAKSPRNKQTTTRDVVFDNEGNPSYYDSNNSTSGSATTTATSNKSKMLQENAPPPPPPPPPPPNRKEIFFPELCGVRINCGDDEDDAQFESSHSYEKNDHRRSSKKNTKNMQDEDNSLLYEENSESSDEDADSDENESERRNSRRRAMEKSSLSSSGHGDNPMNVSSTDNDVLKHNLQPPSQRKTIRQVIQDFEDSDDGSEGVNWDAPSPMSSTFFRRVWRGGKKSSGSTNTRVPDKKVSSAQQSKYGVDVNTLRKGAVKSGKSLSSRSRSRSPSRRATTDGNYDPVDIVRSDPKEVKKTSGFGNILRPKAPMTTNSSDWDDNIPIVQSGSMSDSSTDHNGKDSVTVSQNGPRWRRSSSLDRQGNVPTSRRSMSPSKQTTLSSRDVSGTNTKTSKPLASVAEDRPMSRDSVDAHSTMHPAHPLVNPVLSHGFDKDDALERQSFITAHRQGFDNVNKRFEQHEVPPAISKNSIGNVFNNQKPMVTSDDAFERQSFITGYRQRFDSIDVSQPTGNVFDRQNLGSAQSQDFLPDAHTQMRSYAANNRMSHDDMLERMSYITANRQGMDIPHNMAHQWHPVDQQQMAVYGAPYPKKSERQGRKDGRSLSPFRRSRSQERFRESEKGNRLVNASYDQNVAMGFPRFAQMKSTSGPAQFMSNDIAHAARPVPNYMTNDHRSMSQAAEAGPMYYANEHPANNFAATVPLDNYPVPQPQRTSYSLDPFQQRVFYNGQHVMVNAADLSQQGWPVNDRTYYGGSNAINIPLTFPTDKSDGSVSQQPNPPKDERTQTESDPTWEERTRQAWERLRGGMVALGLDTPNDVKSDECENPLMSESPKPDNGNQQQQQVIPLAPMSGGSYTVQSPSHHRQQITPLQMHETKRVSFGAPHQMFYYDEQDENKTLSSYPDRTKKKKKFRGSKIVSGMFGKAKSTVASISRSTSSESNGSQFMMHASKSWDAAQMHPNNTVHLHSASSYPVSQNGGVRQTEEQQYNFNISGLPAHQHQQYPFIDQRNIVYPSQVQR